MLQKYFLLVGIPRQLIHRPFRNEQPFKNDAHPVANLLHLFQQVGTQEYGHPTPFQVFDNVPDIPRPQRIHAGGRFVQNQQAGGLNQGLRHADALEHPLE